ncbi:MAG TPA: (2Fe-2S) ferredoxin domain-containing protein [Bacteroidetes bacterium]|nr:(2Fe-2S) ferredoxin domain-containing protein [Bacteroidota bacterium]
MRFEKYIFVCTNERPEGHARCSCGRQGSLEILAEFKRLIKARRLPLKIRVNKTGCMELCEIGPSILVHPDNIWYQKVAVTDVEEIIDAHIIGGKPVKRLLADFSAWK